jgi:hypothetical protein
VFVWLNDSESCPDDFLLGFVRLNDSENCPDDFLLGFVWLNDSESCPDDVLLGLVWLNDSESCPTIAQATGKISHTGHVKGDTPNDKIHLGPPWWRLGARLTNSTRYIC